MVKVNQFNKTWILLEKMRGKKGLLKMIPRGIFCGWGYHPQVILLESELPINLPPSKTRRELDVVEEQESLFAY